MDGLARLTSRQIFRPFIPTTEHEKTMTNVDKLFKFIMENLEEVKKQVQQANPEDFDKKEERKEAGKYISL